MAYVVAITTLDGLDQVCDSYLQAAKEMIDLRNMDCEHVRGFVIEGQQAWEAAHAVEDRMQLGRPFGRKGMREFEELYDVKISLVGPKQLMDLAIAETR